MVKEIMEKKLISIPEVKEILEFTMKKMEDLEMEPNPFTESTIEYVNKLENSEINSKIARTIRKMLKDDYDMDPFIANQIININPNAPEEIRIIIDKDMALKSLADKDLTIMVEKMKDLM